MRPHTIMATQAAAVRLQQQTFLARDDGTSELSGAVNAQGQCTDSQKPHPPWSDKGCSGLRGWVELRVGVAGLLYRGWNRHCDHHTARMHACMIGSTHTHHRGLVVSVSFSNGFGTSRAVILWLMPASTSTAAPPSRGGASIAPWYCRGRLAGVGEIGLRSSEGAVMKNR